MMKIKCGIGFDAHKFAEDRKLIIGGIEIPYSLGLAGHSDADVLIHAIIDAIAGPTLGKDIGSLFPDNDNTYKNIDSKILLADTCKLIYALGYSISNIDAEVIAQLPKLAPYIQNMRQAISNIIQIPLEDVTIKATTTEKMGFTGRGEGIAAIASTIVIKEK